MEFKYSGVKYHIITFLVESVLLIYTYLQCLPPQKCRCSVIFELTHGHLKTPMAFPFLSASLHFATFALFL